MEHLHKLIFIFKQKFKLHASLQQSENQSHSKVQSVVV